MKHIKLNRGLKTIVDDSDFDKFGECIKWYATKSHSGTFYVQGYLISHAGRFDVMLSRMIMNCPKGMMVDHINHDTLDNRRANLRICSVTQNTQNRSSARLKSSTGFRGVHRERGKSGFRAAIVVNKVRIRLGTFRSAKEASRAYEEANKKYFGEFGGVISKGGNNESVCRD